MPPQSDTPHDRRPDGPMPRKAVTADAAELARLTTQLGYPVSAETMRSRLARILASAADCVLVVERPDGGLAGWIHGTLVQLIESELRVEIGGLIVEEASRRGGVGRRLVEALEAWARMQGAVELSVRCRDDRAGAHAFYERLGLRHVKTQRVFRKRLAPAM